MSEQSKVSELGVRVAQEDAFRFVVTFDGRTFAPIVVDEPPPLGKDAGPNAARMLAAAIGNCLAASMVFCLGRRDVKVDHGVEAHVSVEIVRNEARRLRIGRVDVAIEVPSDVPPEALEACVGTFEDFCTVTASIRRGIEVDVSVRRAPAPALAGGSE
ncbi:MAG: OsmC family protein [Myxococcota bacterium]|nr:OsmC family protein [Myxococcota bacterium]